MGCGHGQILVDRALDLHGYLSGWNRTKPTSARWYTHRDMPIIHIHVAIGRTAPEKKALLDGVHAALVDAFRIPENDRNQILHEHASEHFESHHGPGFTLVEATVFPGRTAEAKKRLFAAIAQNLETGAGVDRAKLLIVLHEPALECWGIRGGKPATEVAIGFKLDV